MAKKETQVTSPLLNFSPLPAEFTLRAVKLGAKEPVVLNGSYLPAIPFHNFHLENGTENGSASHLRLQSPRPLTSRFGFSQKQTLRKAVSSSGYLGGDHRNQGRGSEEASRNGRGQRACGAPGAVGSPLSGPEGRHPPEGAHAPALRRMASWPRAQVCPSSQPKAGSVSPPLGPGSASDLLLPAEGDRSEAGQFLGQ